MSIPRPTRDDFRRLLALGLPITTVQLLLMLPGVEDSVIVGRLGAAALGAIALGATYLFAITGFGLGLLQGVEPVIAQAVGAGEPQAVARAFQRGLLIAMVVSTLAALSFLPVEHMLRLMGQREELIAIVGPYLRVQAPSVYAFLLFVIVRITLQAHHVTRPILVAAVAANVVNIVLCVGLVYGMWGMPRMGTVGAGVATAIARFVMLGVLVAAAWRELAPLLRWQRASAALAPMLKLLWLGLPAGVQVSLEFGVFAVVSLLMGNLGAVPMAAHQIAINIASLTYMVPLGIGISGSVLVGRAIGAADREGARRIAVAVLVCGVGFMVFSATAFALMPGLIARAYTGDLATIVLASALIPIAAVFQVFDGLQCVSIGLLRGTGDTRTPMIASLLGYWAIGLPMSLWLGRTLHWGPVGLWWGFVAGLVAVSIAMAIRLRVRFGGPLERLHVEAAPPAADLS
jgi:MATE family multidrug resistance protein